MEKETKRKEEIQQIKNIHPTIILELLHIPYEKQGNAFVFSAPYRKDKKPSCMFEPSKLGGWRFVDWGTGISGTVIDFLMQCGYSYKDTMQLLRSLLPTTGAERGTPKTAMGSQARPSPLSAPENNDMEGKKNFKAVSVPAKDVFTARHFIFLERGYRMLPDWLQYFTVETNGKQYTGIGTQDVKGSIHLRFLSTNTDLKEICFGPSSYTHIKQTQRPNTVYIVEGIYDALALWNFGVQHDDIIILNGVGNAHQPLPALKDYKTVIIATDRDKAGQQAAKILFESLTKGQKAFRLVTKAKDPDEDFRNGKRPILKPIKYAKDQ